MTKAETVLLFDGVCNLCVGSVQFVLRNERNQSVKFASLQSDFGKEKKQQFNIPEAIDSLILIENNNVYYYSTAALKMVKYLKGKYQILRILFIFPPFLRDFVYKYIAKNRYKWFGQKELCWLTTPDFDHRFFN